MFRSLLLTLALVSFAVAQTPTRPANDPARPVVGWDSLKSMIPYPEIARRAGVQGYANVSVDIDENGAVGAVSVSGYGIFRPPVEETVRRVQWLPEFANGRPVKTSVVFEIQFQLKNVQDMPKKRVLIIESDIPNASGTRTK